MTFTTDVLIYVLHLLFWSAFGITRLLTTRTTTSGESPERDTPKAQQAASAPWERTVLAVHHVAFGFMYFGLGIAVSAAQVPHWFDGQSLVGAGIIALGGCIASWAVASFASWRFRAKLEQGHQLATNGAFRFMRHPIYMGLNLLALGSAVWVPTLPVWIGAVLMLIGSELRARVEERLLEKAFGSIYTDYCMRTQRFIPGVY